jgi:hypothetical protein
MIWRSRRRADRSQGPGEPSERGGDSSALPGGCNGESGPDAPPDNTPRFSRHLGDSGGEPGKLADDMIFDRLSPTLKAPQQAALRQVLADLSGPAEPADLMAEAAVLTRFRSRVPLAAAVVPGGPARVPYTSPWRQLAPHSPRLAAGLVAAAMVAGGTAAAYAGALPGPLQNFAHQVIDAPAARHRAGQQPGGSPHHQNPPPRPGATSPGQARHSAAPGSARAHTQPGSSAHPSRSAHPAEPRPSANSSPHPGRSSHPVPPQASQPARGSHPARQGRSSRASRPPQPSRGPQQRPPPPHASQPSLGKPTSAPSQAARQHLRSRPKGPSKVARGHVPGAGPSIPGGKLTRRDTMNTPEHAVSPGP